MNSDKITVDGALISTDVDKLIRIIAEKKKVGLNDLEYLSGMERRAIDKWLRVLEDEGYISIIYGLAGTNVLWLGEEEEKHAGEKEVAAAMSDMDTGRHHLHEGYDEVFGELAKEAEKEHVKPAEDYVSRKRNPDEIYDQREDEIKANILGRLKGRKEEKEETTGYSEPETEQEDAGPEETESTEPETPEHEEEREPDRHAFEEAAREMVEPIEETETHGGGSVKKPPRITGDSAKVKDIVNAYLNEINKERAQLEKLETEKTRIYRERYLALESKVEADIASITERILEKEGRVLALKERVLELPDKVEEVGKVHNAIAKLESDGREVLGKTKAGVERFTESIEEAREGIERKMEQSRAKIDAEKERVAKLRELSDEVGGRVSEIKKETDDAEERIGELSGAMKDLLGELEEATEMKVEISDMIEKVGGAVGSTESELNALESQMSEIRKVEQWVRNYVSDYEGKIEEIANYVRSSEDELASLQESAESAYIKKYLRELDNMTANYDTELNRASADEKDVEGKIADSKRRLNELVRDSKEMITKLRSDTASLPDFEGMRQSASNRAATVMQVLAEKESEREQLSDDFQRARGGKPMNPPEPPGPMFSAKAAKLLKSRKNYKARKPARKSASKGKKRK